VGGTLSNLGVSLCGADVNNRLDLVSSGTADEIIETLQV
jgi:hypothetical protein